MGGVSHKDANRKNLNGESNPEPLVSDQNSLNNNKGQSVGASSDSVSRPNVAPAPQQPQSPGSGDAPCAHSATNRQRLRRHLPLITLYFTANHTHPRASSHSSGRYALCSSYKRSHCVLLCSANGDLPFSPPSSVFPVKLNGRINNNPVPKWVFFLLLRGGRGFCFHDPSVCV